MNSTRMHRAELVPQHTLERCATCGQTRRADWTCPHCGSRAKISTKPERDTQKYVETPMPHPQNEPNRSIPARRGEATQLRGEAMPHTGGGAMGQLPDPTDGGMRWMIENNYLPRFQLQEGSNAVRVCKYCGAVNCKKCELSL